MAINFNFKAAAESATTFSKLVEGREKMPTSVLINQYPDGVTVNAFDIVEGEKGAYAIFTFIEAPNAFVNGGAVFTQIAKVWAEGFGGDVEAASEALGKSGGVKIRFTAGRTHKGNNITEATVL